MFTFMAHFLVRHPAGDLRSCQSAVLPICHRLFLDGVYLESASVPPLWRVKAPTPAALDLVVHTISERIARHLERRGLLVRDIANGYLAYDSSDDSDLDELRGHSITYRIGRAGHWVLAACRRGRRRRPARQTRTVVPHHHAACRQHRTSLAHRPRAHPLPIEDAVSAWHDACCVRAIGQNRMERF